jgi:ABC-type branched-subunit amino acid transport system ATPase component
MAAASALVSGDALVLEGVTRSFGALRAIEDISFSVAVGERRAVIGANGAGKTTLFNVVTGDYPATHGRVRFFGEDVTALPPHERIRMGMRRTYQSSLLFRDLTVRDNLFLAVRGVSRNRFSFLRASRRPRWPRCPTASSASSRSAWRWRARRASSSSTSPPPDCRPASARSWWRCSGICRRTSASS